MSESNNHDSEHTTSPASPTPEELVSTICVLGLPEDCTEREFRNLFACAEGYDSGIIHPKQGCCVGFARFQNRSNADRALQRINGYHFQEGSARPISATMANTQLDDVRLSKRRQTAQQKQKNLNHSLPHGIPPTLHIPPTGLPMHYFHPAFSSQMPHMYSPPPAIAPPAPQMQGNRSSPNSTIYLAGLPQDAKESDVLNLVDTLPDYSKMSFSNRQGTHPLIFVKFNSLKAAKSAVEYLNNRVVHISNGVQAQLSAAYAKKELK